MLNQTVKFQLWDSVKNDFSGIFPEDVFRTWFEPLRCLSESDDKVTLAAPNDFAVIWIQDNYLDLINRRLNEASGRTITLELTVDDTPEEPAANPRSASPVETTHPGPAGHSRDSSNRPADASRSSSVSRKASEANRPSLILNPRNNFENFVIGSGNQMAQAASFAVANNPGKAYNPLFLFGDTGLGKTHLMHAIAHHMLTTRPDTKIAYVSTEKFTNEYIEAIQHNNVTRFRQRYRQVDVLLIDDIHFLSGKERIQEEFFHTFNELFERQKQIVLSSDRPAGEIARLESRLVSRFQWGFMADIQPPDYETRLAIIRKKAHNMNLDLPETILDFLAERVSRNVRRMEGALTRVAGYAALMKTELGIETVETLLKDILHEEAQNQVTIEKIQQKVADYHKLRLGDMVSKRRPANIAFPRQIAMYLSRVLTSHSLQDIGDAFGGRDHGTVIHACKTVENIMEQDENVTRTVEYLRKQLTTGRG